MSHTCISLHTIKANVPAQLEQSNIIGQEAIEALVLRGQNDVKFFGRGRTRSTLAVGISGNIVFPQSHLSRSDETNLVNLMSQYKWGILTDTASYSELQLECILQLNES